jgi:hypothetical protein
MYLWQIQILIAAACCVLIAEESNQVWSSCSKSTHQPVHRAMYNVDDVDDVVLVTSDWTVLTYVRA